MRHAGSARTFSFMFSNSAGRQPFAQITSATILAGRDRRTATPAQARNFLDAMRGLFRWAHSALIVKSDPTATVKNLRREKGDGFRPSTEDDVSAYETYWPLGTRQRVWLDVLLYTGLRRGDAVRIGRPHVRDGVASIKTEKTETAVTLPILPVLAKTLDAGPCGDLTFIAGESGRPLTKEILRQPFQEGLHGGRSSGISARRSEDSGYSCGERRGNGGPIGGHLRLVRRHHGIALYTRRRSSPSCHRGDAQACERIQQLLFPHQSTR